MCTKYDIFKGSTMPASSTHGHHLPIGFETFSFVSWPVTQMILQSYNLQVDHTTLGIPTYTLLLNRTWVVRPLTSQRNPIQKYNN